MLEVSELGMTVNNIAPGAAKPEEIAGLAVFLASGDADYVTGATYVMDGGLMQMAGQGA